MVYHKPVLLEECVEGLQIKPGGIYVDCTFGGGGHSREILKHLKTGKLLSFDQDLAAFNNAPEDERFIFVQANFRFLKNFLRYHGVTQVDGILADLGVSWHHFDSPERGFSFRFDGALDMRMNQKDELTAGYIVNTYPEPELAHIFFEYGDVKNARQLARLVAEGRIKKKIERVNEFLEVIRPSIPSKNNHSYLACVFQALRMEVNHEVRNLKELLMQSAEALKPGGRLAVISYHSIEDKLVKNFTRTGNFEGQVQKDFFGNVQAPLKPVNSKVIAPSAAEIEKNNRARSARLRIAERNDSAYGRKEA